MEAASSSTDLNIDWLFIGGARVSPRSAERLTVTSPNTGAVIGSVPHSGVQDVDAAVGAARAAFDDPEGWPKWAPTQRARAMRRFADSIEKRVPEFARRISSQNGMPLTTALATDGRTSVDVLRLFADFADQLVDDEERRSFAGGRTVVRRLPLGVVGAIVPWNFPQTLAVFKYAPALAVGCTVVLKPSPETVLDAALLAEAAEEADLPAGVFNIVPGGPETGKHLVSHPDVDKIAFTGSTEAGRSIGEACGRLMRPVTLELGGKSAAIVLDDADLAGAAADGRLAKATMGNNGQTCHLSTRVLLPRSRYDEMVDVFAELAGSLVVGDSLDPATQVGPMVTSDHRDRVESYIAMGRAEGARLVAGGARPDRRGWFVRPTVFADVSNASTIAQEEIFGPVLSLIPYDGVEEAVRIANDSRYGLAGTVWTSDPERGLDVAKQIVTGGVGLNGFRPDPASPLGGTKDSGLGSEMGPESMAHYQRFQSIYL
ncbi:aldehyde dehydrogenase [Streptomyces nigra]|uniref:aldehyde dehydrogenase n=1 Tax=Streptomyces nigra TaxID=1827580 RepID=UPI00369FE5B7